VRSLASIRSVLQLAGALSLAGCHSDGDDKASPSQDCAVFTKAADSPYTLPWQIGQSYVAEPHLTFDPSVQRYAIDARMPIGTDVLAMRAGNVVRMQVSFYDGDLTPDNENFVAVEHDDGTTARYVHLTHDGALVQLGEHVQRGQRIALSGHTGNSAAPHLHFDVTRGCCAVPPDGNERPQGETLPLTFSNASPVADCGLQDGMSYVALP
jgi:hypothetical protein